MNVKKIITLAIVSLSLVSCSTTSKRSHEKLQKLVKEKKFKDGLTLVKGKDFYADKESKLLKLMELGMLHSLNGNHYQSLQYFDKAKNLSDKLFTMSISKKALSAVSNDNQDNYYGEKYERSMVRFYQALQHFHLSQADMYESYEIVKKNKSGKVLKKVIPAKKLTAKDRRFHLSAARSVLIEWNALLDNYKSTSGGKPTYKDDLLAKVFGAFIHEQLGSSQDRQIAKNLYLAAKKTLFRNFNIYKTYNAKEKVFTKDFSKLSKMPLNVVKKKYLKSTGYYKNLERFIDARLAGLKKNKTDNVYFLISNGFISPKVAKKFDYPIPLDKASLKVGNAGDFISFTTNVLNVAKKSVPKIYFELPSIPFKLPTSDSVVVIYDKNGKEVARKQTALVNPLSEIAYKTLEDNSTSKMVKTGARVVGKHLVALGSAYLIYDTQKKKLGDTIAMMAAGASYAAANKVIENTEGADLRFWSTLPSDYRMTSVSLKPGKYSVKVLNIENGKEILKSTEVLEVENNKNKFMPITSI